MGLKFLNISEKAPAPRTAIAFAGVLLIIFLYAIDGTAVSTAMPTVVAMLGDIELYSWVFSAYMLTSALATPLCGTLSDLYGRQWLMLGGIAVFVAGSVLCGAAQTMAQLIVFRAIQGVGGGAIYALAFVFIGVMFPPERQGKAHGMISAVWAVSSILGPLGGGLITEYWSWRWIFFINLPLALLAAALFRAGYRESDDARAKVQLDIKGAVSLLAGLTLLFYALSPVDRGGQGSAAVSYFSFALAMVILLGFLWLERAALEPIIPPTLFGHRLFSLAAMLASLASLGVFGVIAYLPLYVQGILGGSAFEAGIVLLIAGLAWPLGGLAAGQWVNRTGYRLLWLSGIGLMVLGYGLYLGIGPRGGMVGACLNGFIVCAGMGFVGVTSIVAAQNGVPRQRIGVATTTIVLCRTFGGAFGVSVIGSVLVSGMYGRLVNLPPGATIGLAPAEIEKLSNPHNLMEPATRLLIPERLLPLLVDALTQSIWYAFLTGMALMLLGFCLAPFMDGSTPTTTTRPEMPANARK